MSKRKDSDETEQLRKRNKELESTIRVLRKRLKKLENFFQQKEDLEIEADIKEEQDDLTDEKKFNQPQSCPDCTAILSIIKMANRVFYRCSRYPACKHRTKAEIVDE